MHHRHRDYRGDRVFHGLTGPVLGAKRVPCYDHGGYPDREGTLRWRLTDDLADLQLADDVFITCSCYEDLVVALEARFESPVAGLSRIEPIPAGSTYDGGRGKYVRRGPTDACVHPYPLADPWVTADAGGRGEHAVVAGLSEMAASCPLTTTEDGVGRINGRAFFDSDLTINDTDFAGNKAPKGYRFIKYNPVMARARRTREVNADKKQKLATLLNHQTAGLRATIMAAACRMHGALCGVGDSGLIRVLEKPEDAVREKSSGGSRYGDHGDKAANTDRYGRVLYQWWNGARVLHAYALVYDKYFGRGRHRKLVGFQDVLSELRDVRKVKEIEPRDYGFDADVTAWFDGELNARKPKALEPAEKTEAAHGGRTVLAEFGRLRIGSAGHVGPGPGGL